MTCTGGLYRCIEDQRDVMFCENEAIVVEGKECETLGLQPSSHFCVVTNATCPATHYKLKGHDCRVVEYRPLRESGECSPGSPTFIR